MRNAFMMVLLFAAIACGSTAPAREGFAAVEGHVYLSSGSPFANTTVEIKCAGGSVFASVSTDSSGTFAADLTAPASVMTSPSVTLECSFGAPNLTGPVVALQASIVFGPAGLRDPEGVVMRQSP